MDLRNVMIILGNCFCKKKVWYVFVIVLFIKEKKVIYFDI